MPEFDDTKLRDVQGPFIKEDGGLDIAKVQARAEKYIEKHPVDLSKKDVLRNPYTGETKTKEQVLKDKYFSENPENLDDDEGDTFFAAGDEDDFMAEIDGAFDDLEALSGLGISTDFNNDGQADDKETQRKYEKNPTEAMTLYKLKREARQDEYPSAYYLANQEFLQDETLRFLRRVRRLALDLPEELLNKYTGIDLLNASENDYEKLIFNLEKAFAFVNVIGDFAKTYDISDNAFLSTLFVLFDKKAENFKRVGNAEKIALRNLALAFKVKYIIKNQEIFDLDKSLKKYIDASNEGAAAEDPEEAVLESEIPAEEMPELSSGELKGLLEEENHKTELVSKLNTLAELYDFIKENSPIADSKNNEYGPGELEFEISRTVDLDDRHNIDSVTRRYGIRKKVIELFKKEILPICVDFTGIKNAITNFASAEDFEDLEKGLALIEAGKIDKLNYEDDYGLMNQAKVIWKTDQEVGFFEDAEPNDIDIQKADLPEDKTSPSGFERTALSEVDFLTQEKLKQRLDFEHSYKEFLDLYKNELDIYKSKISKLESNIREIKEMDFDVERMDKDAKYLEKYGDVCRRLVKLCTSLNKYEGEERRLELLYKKYQDRFSQIHANRTIDLPLQKDEERWLNEITEGAGKLNYVSLAVEGSVHTVKLADEAGAMKLFYPQGQSDRLAEVSGKKWQEIPDQKNIEAADARKIDQWMDYGLVIDKADYLTKMRKSAAFYALQQQRNALAFAVEKKYGVILPTIKSNVPIYFKLGQARVAKGFLTEVEKQVGGIIIGFDREEHRAYIEAVLYQAALKDITISRAQSEQIKNRLNALLIKYKKIKPLLDRKEDAYEHLTLLRNGMYAVEKRDEIRKKMMDRKRKLIKADENKTEDVLNVKNDFEEVLDDYDLSSISEKDAAGKVYINHKADLQEIEDEQKRIAEQKMKKEMFVKNYLLYNLKSQAFKYEWDKANKEDFKWFLLNKVMPVLENEDLSTYTEMIKFLEEYPDRLSKENELYGHFVWLKENLLYLE